MFWGFFAYFRMILKNHEDIIYGHVGIFITNVIGFFVIIIFMRV